MSTISNNQPDRDLKFLGASFRLSREILSRHSQWRVSLSGGLYYTTSTETNNSLGFQNLEGPQVSLRIKRLLRGGFTLSTYGKFAFMSPGFSLLNTGNQEVAFGGGVSLPSGREYAFLISADYSMLNLQDVDQTPTQNNTLSVSIGYSF